MTLKESKDLNIPISLIRKQFDLLIKSTGVDVVLLISQTNESATIEVSQFENHHLNVNQFDLKHDSVSVKDQLKNQYVLARTADADDVICFFEPIAFTHFSLVALGHSPQIQLSQAKIIFDQILSIIQDQLELFQDQKVRHPFTEINIHDINSMSTQIFVVDSDHCVIDSNHPDFEKKTTVSEHLSYLGLYLKCNNALINNACKKSDLCDDCNLNSLINSTLKEKGTQKLQCVSILSKTNKPNTFKHLHYQICSSYFSPDRKSEYVIVNIEPIDIDTSSIDSLKFFQKLFTDFSLHTPAVFFRSMSTSDKEMVFISDYIHKLTGYASVEFADNYKSLINCIHPDDRSEVAMAIENSIEQKEPYKVEYRLMHKTGKISYVIEKGLGVDELGKCKFIDGIILDITQMKLHENEITANKDLLHTTLEAIGEAVITTNSKGIVTLLNNKAEMLTGWIKEDAVGTHIDKVFYCAHDSYAVDEIQNPNVNFNGSNTHVNNRLSLTSKNGQTFIIESKLTHLFDHNGEIAGNVFNFRDITEWFDEREKLEKIEFAINHSHDGIYFINENAEFIYANEPILKVLNTTKEHIGQKTLFDLVKDTTNDQFRTNWEVLKQTKFIEFERTFKYGEELMYVHIKNYHLSFHNQSFAVGIVRDISNLKRLQNELEEKNRSLEYLLENMNGVPWRVDFNAGTFTYMGAKAHDILGYPAEQWKTIADWASRLHPEDQQWAPDYCKELTLKGIDHTFEYRVIDSLGNSRWIRDIVNVITDKQGKPVEQIGFMIDVTESKNNEQQIKAQQQQLQIILDSLQSAIFLVDTDKEIVLANNYLAQTLGITKQDIIGKTATEFLPKQFALKSLIAFNKVVKTRRPYTFESTLTLRNKTKTTLNVFVPILDNANELTSVCGNTIDITESVKREHELLKVRGRLDFAMSAGKIMMWDYFVQENRVITNQVFQQLMKYSPGMQEGEFSWLINQIHPLDIGNLYNSYYQHKRGHQEVMECEIRMKVGDDQYMWTLLTGRIVERNKDKEPIRIIGVQIDVTRQKNLLQELSKAKEVAEEANLAKTYFLANLSHEIRTPMNAIIGFSQILEKHITDPAQKEHISSIKASGKTLLSLINNILDLSKIEANKVIIKSEPVDVEQVIDELKHLFQYRYEMKGIGFRIDISEEFPTFVILDELRLKQILINLISNAIKFTDKGEVSIAARFIRHDEMFGNLELSVKDSGIGIAATSIEKIFQPFMQHEGHDSKKYGGTGLGLSISKKLIELMNGEILIESQPHKGSKFTILFKDVEIELKSYSAKSTSHLLSNYSNSRIMVVDAHGSHLPILHEILEPYHIHIISESDADKIDIINESPMPQIIFVDITANDQNTENIIAKLKPANTLIYIPVIAFIAPIEIERKDWYIEMGFDDVMIKPITQNDVINTFQKHLKQVVFSESEIELKQSNVSIEEAQTILPIFDDDVQLLLNDLSEIHPHQQVKQLAELLSEIGEKFNVERLEQLGLQLTNALNVFDVGAIQNSIASLTLYLNELRKVLNHEQ